MEHTVLFKRRPLSRRRSCPTDPAERRTSRGVTGERGSEGRGGSDRRVTGGGDSLSSAQRQSDVTLGHTPAEMLNLQFSVEN